MDLTNLKHSNGKIKYTTDYKVKKFLSYLPKLFIIFLIIGCTILGVFITLREPVNTANGFIVPEKSFKKGDKVLITRHKSVYGVPPTITEFIFSQDIIVGEVLTDAYGSIKNSQNEYIVTFNGEEVANGIRLAEKPESKILENQYVIRPHYADSSIEVKDIIVNKDSIRGKISSDIYSTIKAETF